MSVDLYPQTGVANPMVMVSSGSSITIARAGAMCVRGQVLDFQPVRAEAVMFRLDGGQLGAADAPRGDGPRAAAPPNLTWPVRSGRVAGAAGAAPPDAAGLELVRQNGRPALGFAEGSTGLAVPWGPFTGPSFTAVVVMRTRRVVNAYGPYPGTGAPIPVLTCPGHLTFAVPTGGPAPAALGGVPWDVALLNRWSVVTLANDATAGLRRVHVDEHLVAQTSASTTTIPAGQVLVGGPGLEVSEVIVWDAMLTEAETLAMIAAAEAKWHVMAADVATVTASNTTLPDARDPTNAWPAAVPRPDVWLDAALPGALFWDTAGTQPTPPGGIVARWRDASGNGRDWALGPTAGAVWRTDSTVLSLGGRGGVQVPGGAAWPTTLFEGTGGGPFTAVAVLRRLPGSSAHPFSVAGAARFGDAQWTETLGLNAPVALGTPPPAWTATVSLLVAWDRSTTGTLTFRVGALVSGAGGTHQSSVAPVTDGDWATRPLTVGAIGDGGLMLAAAIVWRTAALTAPQMTALAAWLTQRWGLGPAPTPATLLSFVPASADPVPLNVARERWDVGELGTVRAPDQSAAVTAAGSTVGAWRPATAVDDASNTWTAWGSASATLVAVGARLGIRSPPQHLLMLPGDMGAADRTWFVAYRFQSNAASVNSFRAVISKWNASQSDWNNQFCLYSTFAADRLSVGLNHDLALATITPVVGQLYVAVVQLVTSPARLAAQMVGATLFTSMARGAFPNDVRHPWCLGGVYWPSQNQVYNGGDFVIHEVRRYDAVLDAPLIAAVRAQLLEKWA